MQARRAHPITDSYTLPVDVDLLSVYPHAHHLAKEMEGVAVLPDGRTRVVDSNQEVGFPLAAGLPAREAASASARNDAEDALHVRQFRRKTRQRTSITTRPYSTVQTPRMRWRICGSRC